MVRSGPFGRQAKSAPQKIHPTRWKLIETALQFLEVCSPADITADLILDASGVSKGSLYHHFEDLTDVIDAAMIVRFAVGVNESVKSLADIVSSAKSREELMQGLEAVARSAHVQERTRLRATRIQMISLAHHGSTFSRVGASDDSGAVQNLDTQPQSSRRQNGSCSGRYGACGHYRLRALLRQASGEGRLPE